MLPRVYINDLMRAPVSRVLMQSLACLSLWGNSLVVGGGGGGSQNATLSIASERVRITPVSVCTFASACERACARCAGHIISGHNGADVNDARRRHVCARVCVFASCLARERVYYIIMQSMGLGDRIAIADAQWCKGCERAGRDAAVRLPT